MKKFAVGYMNYFDYELIIEIIEAENWQDALWQHSKLKEDDWNKERFGNTLNEAKIEAFNCDMLIDVVEIPE